MKKILTPAIMLFIMSLQLAAAEMSASGIDMESKIEAKIKAKINQSVLQIQKEQSSLFTLLFEDISVEDKKIYRQMFDIAHEHNADYFFPREGKYKGFKQVWLIVCGEKCTLLNRILQYFPNGKEDFKGTMPIYGVTYLLNNTYGTRNAYTFLFHTSFVKESANLGLTREAGIIGLSYGTFAHEMRHFYQEADPKFEMNDLARTEMDASSSAIAEIDRVISGKKFKTFSPALQKAFREGKKFLSIPKNQYNASEQDKKIKELMDFYKNQLEQQKTVK